MAQGIPAEHNVRDFAGFRTLDSVVRAKEVFGLDAFTVVSQEFHCQRAVYLARAHGMDAIGFCARRVGGSVNVKVRLREVLARTAAVVDVVLLKRRPHFLGDPVPVP